MWTRLKSSNDTSCTVQGLTPKCEKILNYLKRIEVAIKTTFNPPNDATSKQIRVYGLAAWLIGLIAMLIITIATPLLERVTPGRGLGIVFLAVSLVAYGLMATGCYRALTGKKESQAHNPYEVSFLRIIVGLVSVILSITIPATILVLFLYFLQWIGIEPNKLF